MANVSDKRERLAALRAEISHLEQEADALEQSCSDAMPETEEDMGLPLKRSEYRRYGRQMILEGFGLEAQLCLKSSKILVIGAGGLGCPVLLYLASAGVGNITVVDHDHVELSNLHRQVLHCQASVGLPKAVSAMRAVKERNPNIHVEPIVAAFTPSLLSSIPFASYDLVLDCTDNSRTRYLINDACVAFGKTLVSGAAIRLDGQVVCWNLPPASASEGKAEVERGPCYRCVFPAEDLNKAESQNCEDEGVLGSVTGVIGTLMVNEAIRLLTKQHDLSPFLTIYSAFSHPPFRTLKVRGKKVTCLACSTEDGAEQLLRQHARHEELGQWAIETCGIGQRAPLGSDRVSPIDLKRFLEGRDIGEVALVILDVRSAAEYSIASLPGSRNIPLKRLSKELERTPLESSAPIITVCRRGNDSLTAARHLSAMGYSVKDLAGGLRSWSEVDSTFPVY